MKNTIDKINNYLQVGGMFNPELMEHHKVSDLLLECRNELQRLKAVEDDYDYHEQEMIDLEEENSYLRQTNKLLVTKCDKQAQVLQHLTPERYPGVLFIHAHLGEKDQNGLPEKLLIVPSYGCDWSQVYVKSDKIVGGMGS